MRIAVIVLSSVVGFLLAGFIISYIIVNRLMFVKFFKRTSDEDILKVALSDSYYDGCREEIKAAAKKFEELPFEKLEITADDGVKLAAKYYNRGKEKLIIFVHGVRSFPPYCFGVFAVEAYEKGYDLLVVDQRAHWQSGGEYITYGGKESDDLLRWIDAVDKSVKEIYLYGISMGASTVAYASDRIKDGRVKAAVADCGYTSAGELVSHILKRQKVPKFLVAAAFYFGEKVAKADMKEKTEEHLAKTDIPTFFLHGEDDYVVPKEQTVANFDACSAKKRIEIVKNAGHACAAVIGGKELRDKIFKFLGDENE